MKDRLFDYTFRPRVNVLYGERCLEPPRLLDRLFEAIAGRGEAEDIGFVEMDVALDEAAAEQFSARVVSRCLRDDGGRDVGDPSVRDADIDEPGSARQTGIGDDAIEAQKKLDCSILRAVSTRKMAKARFTHLGSSAWARRAPSGAK